MKFLYLVEWNCNGLTGVERKIKSQMNVWNELGCDVKAVIIGKHSYKDKEMFENAKFDFWNIPDIPMMKFSIVDQLIKQFYFILIWFKYYSAGVSFVYYRVSTLSMAFIFNIHYKVVLDINSVDTEVVGGLKKMIAPISHLYRYLLFRYAVFCCFITDELKKYYSEKYPVNTNATCVLGNGYYDTEFSEKEVTDYFSQRTTKKRRKPCLLFIGFGSDAHYWHGYDKFIDIVSRLPQFDFILVGKSKNFIMPPHNLKVIDNMYKEDVLNIFSQADIGIGTLALHRINMNEASPLKIAEYIFFGLPVITAYKDINISGKNFNLELTNTEDNINEQSLVRIVNFVNQFSGYTLNEEERGSVNLFNIEAQRIKQIQKILHCNK